MVAARQRLADISGITALPVVHTFVELCTSQLERLSLLIFTRYDAIGVSLRKNHATIAHGDHGVLASRPERIKVAGHAQDLLSRRQNLHLLLCTIHFTRIVIGEARNLLQLGRRLNLR
jgi:hypothetical protein